MTAELMKRVKQGRFYAFRAFAHDYVAFPEYLLELGRGNNTFNLAVEDLEGFLSLLEKHGVRVLGTFPLDDFEAPECDNPV